MMTWRDNAIERRLITYISYEKENATPCRAMWGSTRFSQDAKRVERKPGAEIFNVFSVRKTWLGRVNSSGLDGLNNVCGL